MKHRASPEETTALNTLLPGGTGSELPWLLGVNKAFERS